MATFYFDIDRDPAHYESNVIVSVFVFVIISYVSFYIDRSAAPARVGLTIICFLVTNTYAIYVAETVPPAKNEAYWISRFIRVSLLFNACAIFEFAVCNALARSRADITSSM